MKLVSASSVVALFDALNASGQEYILLRNNLNELPDRLEIGKDIDVLIRWAERDEIFCMLGKLGFKRVNHPHSNDVFLYGVKKFEFFQNIEDSIIVDVHFSLTCRSLNAGEWIPFDQELQLSAWNNRQLIKNGRLSAWMLSDDDLFVALVARSVFDKRAFQHEYVAEISCLLPLIRRDRVLEKLHLIFFKFSSLLLQLLEKGEFDLIVKTYITYSDY